MTINTKTTLVKKSIMIVFLKKKSDEKYSTKKWSESINSMQNAKKNIPN